MNEFCTDNECAALTWVETANTALDGRLRTSDGANTISASPLVLCVWCVPARRRQFSRGERYDLREVSRTSAGFPRVDAAKLPMTDVPTLAPW